MTTGHTSRGDHPHRDPGDGRTECDTCGKWVWRVTHSCKRVPITDAAKQRYAVAHGFESWAQMSVTHIREAERGQTEQPLPGTEALAEPARPSRPEQPAVNLVTKAIERRVRPGTEGDLGISASRAALIAVRALIKAGHLAPPTAPTHPMADDKWTRVTAVPGVSVAIDASNSIVLHLDSGGTRTITNVAQLIEDLLSAREARDVIEKRSLQP